MSARAALLCAVLGSVALLCGAFAFQLAGYPPCTMCLWQRWPHAVAIAVGGASLMFGHTVLLVTGCLALLVTSGIGFFHAGVEQGWWPGPGTCTSGAIEGLSPDALLEQILNAPLVRCDEIAWQFLSISMAGWNAGLSLGLAALWLWAALKSPSRHLSRNISTGGT